MFLAFPVHVNGAGDKSAAVRFQPANSSAGDESRASLDVLRPMRDVHRTFRAFYAAPHARGALSAGPERTVSAGGNRVGRGPPMPAQIVVRFRDTAAHRRERRRWKRRAFARRESSIAGEARHAEVGLDAFVERLKVLVTQRPVVPDAIECAHAKVRRHVALPVRGIYHCAAADRVVEHRGDVRVPVINGIIGGCLAAVGIARPVAAQGQLEIRMIGARLGVVRPIALFEHDHAQARLGEPLRRHRAGRTGARRLGSISAEPFFIRPGSRVRS